MLCYRGEVKILNIILNYERFFYKIKSLEIIENIKKSYSFSKLDILNGKLSKAVAQTETTKIKFKNFQDKLLEEAYAIMKDTLGRYESALSLRDKDSGRTPLHYAAMSKYPLCLYIVNGILDFDFFKIDESWEQFLALFSDIQTLEIKEERYFDPRRSLRLERELSNLLGEGIIKELTKYFIKEKKIILKKVLNTQDNQGDSVLHVAAFHGDYRIVNKLLVYNADKNLRNDDNKIPVDLAKDNFVRKVLTNLNKAAKNADVKNVTELVHFGHDINERLSIFNQAPIHKVIESKEKDKYKVLKKVLDMGADPNMKDSNSWTALHYACEFGDLESVKILLANKANVDAYSNNHRTGLHLAASMNFPSIVTFLLENQADPNMQDSSKCIPLHLAAKYGNIECMAILLSFGANLYAEDFRKWNILHYAAFYGHAKAVRYISKYDADYNILQTVRNSQNKLAIEIVRDYSIKPYFISLWHASKEGDLDMARGLLNDGENINEESTFMKNTPLHIAVFNNHYLLVRLLVELGANPEIRNKDGITPSEFCDIIYAGVLRYYKECEDTNEVVDLRNFVRNVYNKNEKVLDATISLKNHKVSVWHLNDFSEKIYQLLVGKEIEEKK